MLGIKNDFEAIVVVDPAISVLTKKDVFKNILLQYQLQEKEVLVVGDDLHSEIKAAQELGIDTVLYDYQDLPALAVLDNRITNFSGLQRFL
jgi:putative hydrolase of the HAD superfamily